MGIIFNANEVFEIAAQIERNGELFYRKAAEVATSSESKRFLFRMAEMEADHAELFADLKEKFAPKEGDIVPDSDGQALSYLKAIAESEIFQAHDDPAGKITGKENLETLYNMAIDFEKDSVIFFTGIKALVAENLGKNKIDDLIKEEMGHIAVLSRELAVIKKNNCKT